MSVNSWLRSSSCLAFVWTLKIIISNARLWLMEGQKRKDWTVNFHLQNHNFIVKNVLHFSSLLNVCMLHYCCCCWNSFPSQTVLPSFFLFSIKVKQTLNFQSVCLLGFFFLHSHTHTHICLICPFFQKTTHL